jgi:hypothetical protein
MKAPLQWFLYISHPPSDGDWADAMRQLKADLTMPEKQEIEEFLRSAQTASEDDLYIIESVALDDKLYLQPEKGRSIRSTWAEQLRNFLDN